MREVLAQLTRRQLNLAGFAACAALLAFAFFAEHALRLVPCNMCLLQRLAVAKLGFLFLLAGIHDPKDTGARIYGGLIALAASAGAALAARHVWMQLQPLGSLPSCGADLWTLLSMLPPWEAVARILHGGGDCQVVSWTLLGLSMPAWLLVAFAVLGLAALVANFRLNRAASKAR